MSVQEQIDDLLSPTPGLGGLPVDRAMLAMALRLGTEGGKRFRPWLFDAAHREIVELVGPGDRVSNRTIDAIGASIELLHTAFVIHDDVMDTDDMRRGGPSVPGWFAQSTTRHAARYSQAGAILTGDLALAASIRGVASSGAPPHVTAALLDLFEATLYDSAAGELADVRLSSGGHAPDLVESLSVAELKTAAYSFVLPLQAAAIVAGGSPELIACAGEVGRALGIAFQLRDDLLGTFGDFEVTGKEPAGDIREGKRTPLVVHAARSSHWWRIQPHLGDRGLGPDAVASVRQALVDAGSVAFVEDLIARYVRRARAGAATLNLDASIVEPLTSSWAMGSFDQPRVLAVDVEVA